MTALAAGALLAAALALLVAPGRPLPRPRRPMPVPRRRRRRRSRARDLDLGSLVMEVATRLRAGAPVEQAWGESFDRAGLPAGDDSEDGVPPQLLALARRPLRTGRAGRRRHVTVSPTTAGALPGTLAACRLTRELGAPLADVLQRCADGLTEAGQAQAARSIALAGPRATARLLGWLPALGLVLGLAVGADPFGVLLGGGAGTACLVLGIALVLAGRRWVAALQRAAVGGGTERGRRFSRARSRGRP
ncbi:type II secretion system F family protein [Georgenia alba]|uniref:Type II secretion system F family protein n=1 Tax=Georgenia alba TaxID=2233858 RepID=A0ABW2Q4Q8_9MICO